jgi:histidine ammonia-lyase
MSLQKVELDGESLTIDMVVAVARRRAQVVLAASARTRVEESARLVAQWAKAGEVIYGVTTGAGPMSEIVIPDSKARDLQNYLLTSHAAGVGDPLPTEVVRAAMLLRANTLAKGYSGIRLETLETLLTLLNKGVHPLVPAKGSVGASGDLAPLSHMALVLVGRGEAEYNGEILPGADALRRAKIVPIQLERKEGIALINGTQVMTALAALAVADARNLAAAAEIAAGLSVEALEGVLDAFDSRIHKLRPHPGQQQTARNLLAVLNDSTLVVTSRQRGEQATRALQALQKAEPQLPSQEQHAATSLLHEAAEAALAIDRQLAVESGESANQLRERRDYLAKLVGKLGFSTAAFEAAVNATRQTGRVQDAYSLRCAPQVIGAVRDAISYASGIATTEINSATDNPLIFPADKTFLSGGNFHGQPIAIAMDLLAIALTSIGMIADRRIARLIDHHLSGGLPLLLLQPTLENQGVHYGLGLAQIAAAALAAECQTLSSPASITTIPTSANQEDHVSMGTIAARKAREVVNNVEHIVAIELLCATQGIDLRLLQKQGKIGRGSKAAYDAVRKLVPRITQEGGEKRDRLTQDTLVHRDIAALWALVHNGVLTQQVVARAPGFLV